MNREAKAGQDKLKKYISKNITTTMIAAISAFEERYSDLWGNGVDNLTEEQLREWEIWQETRNKILDIGNANIRHANNELDCYEVYFNGYNNYTFINRPKGKNNGQ